MYNYSVNIDSITFEWNERKDRTNKAKHDVSFEEARTVFFDEHARLIHDPDNPEDEDRFILMGYSTHPRLLIVIHCYRSDDQVIRIISARKATNHERKQYEEFPL